MGSTPRSSTAAEERIIFLGSPVMDEIANASAPSSSCSRRGPRPRHLPLHQQPRRLDLGRHGDLRHDAVRRNDVATVGLGLAASMGQFLLCAGAKGKRYATAARADHDAPALRGIGGTAADIAIQAEQMLYVKKQMAERHRLPHRPVPEQIEKDSDRDRWFSADEAKDYGFIDHVVAGASQVPSGAGTRS
jgi:ATP-dependent Clp protease protease subunit